MGDYNRHLRDFEKSVSALSSAMEGMHQQHTTMKKQFRKYVADHEVFTRNVRMYLDELDHGDEEQNNSVSSTTNRGQNDNRRDEYRVPNQAGE